MSAIIGRIELGGRSLDVGLFEKAFAAIAHYGRDGGDFLVDGAAAIGQQHFQVARRTAKESQPVREGPFTLVADAIVDNRDDLIDELKIDPREARYLPDSALILSAYQKWGADCPHHILGDFAFAVWDNNRRELFLARDHIGARPLYWRLCGDTVVFATDVRALVAMVDLDWQIDTSAVSRYVQYPRDPMKRGFFKGLEICQPGGIVKVDARGSKAVRWWDPSKAKPEQFADSREYAQRLRQLVEESIASRVDTDLKIGSHISGGIDSTSVTILAQRQLRLRGSGLSAAYSWAPEVSDAFPEMGEKDERRAIRDAADHENFPVRWGTADGNDILRLLDYPIELFGTADLADELPVIDKASKDGIGVMLSGWGGDEGFSAWGLGFPALLLKRGKIMQLARMSRRRFRNAGLQSHLAFLWSDAVRPIVPEWLPFAKSRSNLSLNAGRFFLAHPAINNSAQGSDLSLPSHPNMRIRSLLLHGHIGARMETWAALSAEKSYVYRYPLTCRRLLEFVVGIPSEHFMQNGIYRYLVQSAVADLPIHLHRKYDSANELARSRAKRQFARQVLQENRVCGMLERRPILELHRRIAGEHANGDQNQLALDIEIYEFLVALRSQHLIART